MTNSAVAGEGVRLLRWQPSAAVVVRWATVLGLLIVWELVARGPMRANDFLAPPSDVMTTGLSSLVADNGLVAIATTTGRYLIAFAVVVVFGPLLGLLLGRLSASLFHGARDVVSVFYSLPMVPFYPILVLWFGLGRTSEIVFGVLHGIVPAILMVMVAAFGVSHDLLSASRAMGAGPWSTLTSIIVPAVVPEMVSALKVGSALTLLGVLLAELMISVDGIGALIGGLIANHVAAELDALVLLVCVGAVVINAVLAAVERRFSFWRE